MLEQIFNVCGYNLSTNKELQNEKKLKYEISIDTYIENKFWPTINYFVILLRMARVIMVMWSFLIDNSEIVIMTLISNYALSKPHILKNRESAWFNI